MTKVIAIVHNSGGVSRTTTVANLATGMANAGTAVVAIDLDPQGNLGLFLGLDTAPDVYDLLMAHRPERILAGKLAQIDRYPYLRIIRGDDETKGAELALGSPYSSRTLVGALEAVIEAIRSSTAIRSLGNTPPYILLDTPAGSGPLQLAALTTADYMLIPLHPTFASETGLPPVAQQVQAIRENTGRGATLLGIIPTRYKPNTLEHKEVLGDLARTFGERLIYPPVRDTVRLEEAPGRGLPIWDHDPQGIGAQDYAAVLARLLRDLGVQLPGKDKKREEKPR